VVEKDDEAVQHVFHVLRHQVQQQHGGDDPADSGEEQQKPTQHLSGDVSSMRI